MQDIAIQFEKHYWIHSVSLFPPQVHVGRSPINNSPFLDSSILKINKQSEQLLINEKYREISIQPNPKPWAEINNSEEKIKQDILNIEKNFQY